MYSSVAAVFTQKTYTLVQQTRNILSASLCRLAATLNARTTNASWRQSLTKFYDGHNVTVGGAVASATKEINEKIHFYSNIHGNILRCVDVCVRVWVMSACAHVFCGVVWCWFGDLVRASSCV